ncbi:MAG: hypothetical protein V3R47_01480 [candidate division NC10 bacterium]
MRRLAGGCLLFTLVWVGCSSEAPSPPRPARQPPRQKVAKAPGPGQKAGAPERAPVKLGPAKYDPEGRRDPFHPLVEPPKEETALDVAGYKLSGIVWQRKQYFALLETPDGLGHILRVNDKLGPNARVKAITKDAVLIEMTETGAMKGKVRTIRLELQKKEEGR